jgi:hypothetical protein
MFSSQYPPSTHLHQSLVRTFSLQSGSGVERFDVTSTIQRRTQASEYAAVPNSQEGKPAADQRPNNPVTILQFTAHTVSANRLSTKTLHHPLLGPEDWEGVSSMQNLYMGDATGVNTKAIGKVWGLAEGQHCIPDPENPVVDTRYSLVALLAVDPLLALNPGRPKSPLSQTYFCIVVCDEGDVSRRVGMVSLNERAFEEAGPEWKVCRLV